MASSHPHTNGTSSGTQSEQALRTSELRYRRLFEAAQDGILILDAATGRITDANPFLIHLLGLFHGEMMGKTVGELSPFKDKIPNQTMLELLQKDGYVRYEDLPLETRSGHKISVEFVSNVYQAGEEKVIQCNIRNITARKKAEQQLAESGQRLALAKQAAHIGIWEWDVQSDNLVWDAQMYALYGIRKQDFSGAHAAWQNGVHPEDRQRSEAEIFAAVDGVQGFHSEFRVVWPGGEVRQIEAHAATFGGHDGVPQRMIGVNWDITERKNLERQLRQSQKMECVGHLAGGVAHDFNNILAVIQMQTELFVADGQFSPTQSEFVEAIAAATHRATALTKQLLLFSRQEAMQLRDLDLNKSVNSTTSMLRRTLGEDIQLQFKFSPQPLFVHADASMLGQVLLNLATNSRDSMPKGGQLVVETSAVDFDASACADTQARPGPFACLRVSDTGCGIPPENLNQIFEPFFTTKEVGKGTGLGLATVFGIVKQHHGWIKLESEVGHGTTFRIYLPRLATTSPVLHAGHEPEPAAARGGGETILLVEDDNFVRSSMVKTLGLLGYRVREARNGPEALDVWQQHGAEIDLLLTDLVMPGGMTGRTLGERLLRENSQLKVIYASGYSTEIAGKDLPLEAGVSYLAKPFDGQKLAQTILSVLDAPIASVMPIERLPEPV